MRDLLDSNTDVDGHFHPLPQSELLLTLRDTAMALCVLHEHELQIVHRDVKAENVFVQLGRCQDGAQAEDSSSSRRDSDSGSATGNFGRTRRFSVVQRAALGDFGEAHALAIGEPPEYNVGSPGFIAPECLRLTRNESTAPLSCAADIWAFGCMIVELTTGRAPYARECIEPLDMLEHVHAGHAPLLSHTVRRDPALRLLVELFDACTQMQPTARPSARELRSRLTGEPERKRIPAEE